MNNCLSLLRNKCLDIKHTWCTYLVLFYEDKMIQHIGLNKVNTLCENKILTKCALLVRSQAQNEGFKHYINKFMYRGFSLMNGGYSSIIIIQCRDIYN